MRTLCVATTSLLLACALSAQEQAAPPQAEQKTPEIHVTYLNVCTPSDEETQQLSSALAKIPLEPPFASDFEVSRGRSTSSGGEIAARLTGGNLPPSTFVRLRREFASGFFANVQYSMTRDENGVFEVLVFRVRDPKDLMQIALTDSVTGGNPATVMATDTPVARVKLERFGKSSVGLSRCPAADQKPYEPLFRSASRVMSRYRTLLGARSTVPAEFARLGTGKSKPPAKPAAGAAGAKPQKP